MKKIIFSTAALFFLCIAVHITAQNSLDSIPRYNIKFSYNGAFDFDEQFSSVPKNYYRAEVNYRLLSYLDVGIQTSYAKQKVVRAIVKDGQYIGGRDLGRKPKIGLGLNTNFYPLYLIFDYAPQWIEPYISAKYAYSHIFAGKLKENERRPEYKKHRYGIYGGLNFYLGKYFGIYAEFGRSNIQNYENYNSNIGITIKF